MLSVKTESANNALKHQTYWQRKATSLQIANVIILRPEWPNLSTSISLKLTVHQLETSINTEMLFTLLKKAYS